jgi:hypothetical protein
MHYAGGHHQDSSVWRNRSRMFALKNSPLENARFIDW